MIWGYSPSLDKAVWGWFNTYGRIRVVGWTSIYIHLHHLPAILVWEAWYSGAQIHLSAVKPSFPYGESPAFLGNSWKFLGGCCTAPQAAALPGVPAAHPMPRSLPAVAAAATASDCCRSTAPVASALPWSCTWGGRWTLCESRFRRSFPFTKTIQLWGYPRYGNHQLLINGGCPKWWG